MKYGWDERNDYQTDCYYSDRDERVQRISVKGIVSLALEHGLIKHDEVEDTPAEGLRELIYDSGISDEILEETA